MTRGIEVFREVHPAASIGVIHLFLYIAMNPQGVSFEAINHDLPTVRNTIYEHIKKLSEPTRYKGREITLIEKTTPAEYRTTLVIFKLTAKGRQLLERMLGERQYRGGASY